MGCLEYANKILKEKNGSLFLLWHLQSEKTLSSAFIHRGEQRGYKSPAFNMKLSGSALQCLHSVGGLSRGHLHPSLWSTEDT